MKEKTKIATVAHQDVANYLPPRTLRTAVQTEGSICATSADIKNPDDETNGRIYEHDINTSSPEFKDGIQWD